MDTLTMTEINTLTELLAILDKRFDAIDKRFDAVDATLVQHTKTLAQIQGDTSAILSFNDTARQRLEKLESKKKHY